VQDIVIVAAGLIAAHPAVKSVTFAGSRSRGTHDEPSDWDFAVDASDFEALAPDLPTLVAPLDPLGQQWNQWVIFRSIRFSCVAPPRSNTCSWIAARPPGLPAAEPGDVAGHQHALLGLDLVALENEVRQGIARVLHG